MRRLGVVLASLRLRMALLLLMGMCGSAALAGVVTWQAVAAAWPSGGAPPPPALVWRHLPDYAILLALVSTVLALLAVRYVTRSLRQLADAAGRFAISLDPQPLGARGPSEFRPVVDAFNLMQRRVSEGVQERMHMLSAINHDLRTPMARLALRLDAVADPTLRGRLQVEVRLLDAMVAKGMELARGASTHEPRVAIDLPALLQTVADEAQEAGGEVTCDPACRGAALARPETLHRCVTNLVDNAVRYGGGATLTSAVEGGFARIAVLDRGPGIPEPQLEAAFQPFLRLGRTGRQVDGSGLGLTIARQQARSLGGELVISNRNGGGLAAVITLPSYIITSNQYFGKAETRRSRTSI